MTDLKQETTKNLVGIFSFIALLVITMVLFKINQTQTTQKQSANIVAINSNDQVANNVIAQNQKNLSEQVKSVFDEVKNNGDKALKFFTEKFDNVILNDLKVSEIEVD